ncbi:MmgE/PrpD family protein [Pseudarthrobacter sulfonivorans]|uniref:MmgE/PrpD family protein n=1 Tax=Pseudarthrobacter sulfonivorans TaxID=121292 RepID=UPI00168A884B|nr:MmgE/PrpD family protein [Pseudarthrobacter sulfonivorans]
MAEVTAPEDLPLDDRAPHAASLTDQLIERIRGIDGRHKDAVAGATHCILDTLGVAIAGSREPVSAVLLASLLSEGSSGQAGVWGTNERVSRTQAAFVNGTAAHALDFDDVSAAMEGHPSAPLLPALLAAAEGSGISGSELITAFVMGFETEAMIGRLMSPSHYARGFHTTATVGTFGAAAASAQVLGIEKSKWLHAFGIAGSQASGLKSMFGTMTKPLQVGAAAENGLRSALLARGGVTAHPDVLGAAQGFRDTQSDEAGVPVEWGRSTLAISDVLFKYHAACYLTHSAIEGLLAMREAGLTLEQVRYIQLQVPPGHLKVCNIQTPSTPLEGKFSLRFVTALALAKGDLSESVFDEGSLQDHRVMGFLDRVHVEARTGELRSSIVSVTLNDGTQRRADVDVNEPTPSEHLDRRWTGLVSKFHSLVDPVLGREAAEDIVSLVAGLEAAPSVEPLLEALGRAPSLA